LPNEHRQRQRPRPPKMGLVRAFLYQLALSPYGGICAILLIAPLTRTHRPQDHTASGQWPSADC
jgi:hypothetical protein